MAWAHIAISPTVRQGETVNDWYPLSGKQGEEKEGSVNLVLSYTVSACKQGKEKGLSQHGSLVSTDKQGYVNLVLSYTVSTDQQGKRKRALVNMVPL